VPEEATGGSGVGMVVVRDVPHVVVHVMLAKLAAGDLGEAFAHVGEMISGRLHAVKAPHYHGHLTDLTLGDPADLILVVPGRDVGGATEVAAGDAGEAGIVGGGRGRHGPMMPWTARFAVTPPM
jgi:hypothetical protein